MTIPQTPPGWEESLSALMDGEANELEIQRLLGMADRDAEVRARWSRYQLAAALVHQQQVAEISSLALADRIRAQLAQEPPQLAAVRPRSRGRSFAGLAVAASVALAVVAGVQWQQRLSAQQGGQLAATLPVTTGEATVAHAAPAKPVAPLTVVAAESAQRPLQKPVLFNAEQERYMRYHLERVALDPNRGMVPMASTAVERGR